MGWEEVWHLAMKHFAAEPIELRIVIGLVLAFFALMIVVGIRHAFHPAGPKPEPRLPEAARPLVFAAAPPPAAIVMPAIEAAPAVKPQPFRTRKVLPKAVLKAAKDGGKPYVPMRPQIRRQAAKAKPVRLSRV